MKKEVTEFPTTLKGNHVHPLREIQAKNQNRLTLDWLLSGKTITQPEAGKELLIGYLPARIKDLKYAWPELEEFIEDEEINYSRADGTTTRITRYFIKTENIQVFMLTHGDTIEEFGLKTIKDKAPNSSIQH